MQPGGNAALHQVFLALTAPAGIHPYIKYVSMNLSYFHRTPRILSIAYSPISQKQGPNQTLFCPASKRAFSPAKHMVTSSKIQENGIPAAVSPAPAFFCVLHLTAYNPHVKTQYIKQEKKGRSTRSSRLVFFV